MFKKTSLFIILSIGTLVGHSQTITRSVISSGGGFGENSSYNVSYTIGELSIKSWYLTNNVFTEGFQQGKYHNNIPQLSGINVFPNPVRDWLSIFFVIDGKNSFLIQVYNLNGRLVETENIENIESGNVKQLNFINYKAGLYFLKITSNTGKTLTFKVEKM